MKNKSYSRPQLAFLWFLNAYNLRLILTTTIFVGSFHQALAQSQVNTPYFVNRTSNKTTPIKWSADSCPVAKSTTDIFFTITNGVDSGIKYDEVDKRLAQWDLEFQNIDKSLDPELCCYTSTLIRDIADRLKAIINTKRAAEMQNFQVNSASANTAEYKKADEYITELNKRARIFFGINRIHGNPKVLSRFFPAGNREEASIVYQKYGTSLTQLGSNIAIYGWENRGTINPEIVSTFFGPFRFGVNTLLTSTADTNITEQAQLRTLTGNGGNLVTSFYTPIYHFSKSWMTTLIEFAPKLATELPILNSPFKGDEVYANINLGLNFGTNLRLGAILGGASLFFYARPSYIIASKTYKTALLVDKDFLLFQPVIGIDIPYLGRLGFNFPTSSNIKALRTDSYQISFIVSPQSVVK